jgi:hypothetical protein
MKKSEDDTMFFQMFYLVNYNKPAFNISCSNQGVKTFDFHSLMLNIANSISNNISE